MRFVFMLLWLWPLVEIAGFIVIGGRIGLLASLLWLAGAAFAGTAILRRGGGWQQAQDTYQRHQADFLLIRGMFDEMAIPLAALLLIIPGFVGDIVAVALLVRPLRHLLYRLIAGTHMQVYKEHTDETVIDGTFRRTDNNNDDDPRALKG